MTEPAEAHGTLAGSLCTAVSYRFEDWLLEILPEGRAQAEAAAEALREVYARTAQALVGDDPSFDLLLPEEEEPIDMRTAALAQWCQGFLAGFGLTYRANALSVEATEVLQDLAAIAQVQDALEESDDGESDYMEVMEYLRVAPLLLFTEVNKPAEPTAKPSLH